MQQSTSQKKIKDSNTELWKVIQSQSIIDRFASEDNLTNTEAGKKCLSILNSYTPNKPTGWTFNFRKCDPNLATDKHLIDCKTAVPDEKRPKIIHLTGGTGTLSSEWDFNIPVKATQCCSLFYEEIIDKADGKSGLPTNIQTQIDALPATTHATRKTEVEKVVELIIADTTTLTYAKNVCGDAVVGGSGNPNCYKVTDDSTGELSLSLVGCGDTTEVSVDKHTAFGFGAGKSTKRLNSTNTGEGNTFVGYKAGHENTGGKWNSFFGRSAGLSNTTGGVNSFFGYLAGRANTSGHNNSFFGNQAGRANIGGKYNNFFGSGAGYSNITGNNNSFFGYEAGYTNETGDSNSFFGSGAGIGNTTGKENNFFGSFAGGQNIGGHKNSFFGFFAGTGNTTGRENNFFGSFAGLLNKTGSNNIAIGHRSGCKSVACEDESYKLDIGGLITGNLRYETAPVVVDERQVTIHGDLIIDGELKVKKSTTTPGRISDYFTLDTNVSSPTLPAWLFPETSSDRRLKTKIKDLKNQSHSLLKLNPKTFYWKDKHKVQTKQIGLIAQEVQKEYPELVLEGSDPKKTLSLNYQGLIPVIIKAFKEFYGSTTKTLNFLKESVSALTKSLADLKKTFQTEFLTVKKELGASQSQIEETKIKLKQTSDDVKTTTKEMTKKLKETQLQTKKKLASTNKKLERELTSLKKENTSLKENLNSLIKRVNRLEKTTTKL